MDLQIRGRITRDVEPLLRTLLTEEPAVLLEGPRGSGKSTLLHQITAGRATVAYDLDDDAVLATVLEDPAEIMRQDGLVIVDEFQRAPAVLSVVKRAVDARALPGMFLLAGSVSSRLLPTGSETLTGRAHRLHLPPLSAGEVVGTTERLLPVLVGGGDLPRGSSGWSRRDYFDLIEAGGYPAALKRPTATQRRRWFASYLAAVAERDLPELVTIRHPGVLSRLYRLIAGQTASVIGRQGLGQEVGITPATARSYIDLLLHTHLVFELPAWTVGLSAKVASRPKLHVGDTGLGAAAIGMSSSRLATSGAAGGFMESLVVLELSKQVAAMDESLTLTHFRDRSGVEVDVLVERLDGTVLAFEVKSATTVGPADSKGLRWLRDRLGDRFAAGVVLHTGPLTARLGDRIWSAPISSLWGYARPADS